MDDSNELDDMLGIGFEADGIDLSFELQTSQDGTTVVLTCRASESLSLEEYSMALRAFVEQLDSEEGFDSSH